MLHINIVLVLFLTRAARTGGRQYLIHAETHVATVAQAIAAAAASNDFQTVVAWHDPSTVSAADEIHTVEAWRIVSAEPRAARRASSAACARGATTASATETAESGESGDFAWAAPPPAACRAKLPVPRFAGAPRLPMQLD